MQETNLLVLVAVLVQLVKAKRATPLYPYNLALLFLIKSNGNLFQCVPFVNTIDNNGIWSSTTAGQCQLIGNTANM